MPRVNARASLLVLTSPSSGMRALLDPPQHTQLRDLSLTSTCRRSWSARPARDVGCPCTSISRLCSPRHAGGCYERHEGTTSAGNHEQSSESHQERLQRPQGAHLPRRRLACRAPREASKGGRMRAVLLSARRAKPAETLTWPSRTLTLSGMAASVRGGHRRAMPTTGTVRTLTSTSRKSVFKQLH